MSTRTLFAPWSYTLSNRKIEFTGMVVEGMLNKACRISGLCQIKREKIYSSGKLITEIESSRRYVELDVGIISELYDSIGRPTDYIESGFTGIVIVQTVDVLDLPDLKDYLLFANC